KIVFFVTIAFFLVNAAQPPFLIYDDSSHFDTTGYDNCDSHSNGEYDIATHYIKNQDIVFDVGANRGEWSLFVLSQFPTISLYAFEPIPNTFNSLKNNLQSYYAHTFNIAFSIDKREKKIAYYNNSLT